MTTIGAATPQVRSTATEPRFKVPVPRELSDDEKLNAQLTEWGISRADWDARMAHADRVAAESDRQRKASGVMVKTFASAADAASYGQRLVGSLGSIMESANALRHMLASKDQDAWNRLMFGDEWADASLRRLREGIAVMERGVAGYEREIGEKFGVQGTLTRRDEAGNLAMGAFVIEHRGGGGVARVGSDGTAWLAGGDGAFRRHEAPRDPEPAGAAPERISLLA